MGEEGEVVDEGEAVVVLGSISAFSSKNFLDELHAYLWRITILELNGRLRSSRPSANISHGPFEKGAGINTPAT